jgi:putative ABC transport system, lipoprotein
MKTITYTAALTLVMSVMTACGTKPDYDATGIFEATTVTVSAETSGRILEFDIEEGDSVMAGRQVALVDTVLLSLQQGQSESQRRSATASSPDIEAQASALRSQIAHAENEVRRQQKLLASGATTQVIADDAEAQLKALRGQLEALLSTLGKSRSSIADNASAIHYQRQQIAQQIARCHIMSPITGTVLDKYAEAGEYAVPGKPLFKIADLGNIYLRAYFTASQLADLRIGQRVTVIADFGGHKQFEYPGTITWIADESEFTPKSIQTEDSRANLVYAVKVAVKNDGRLKLGQYGEVRL